MAAAALAAVAPAAQEICREDHVAALHVVIDTLFERPFGIFTCLYIFRFFSHQCQIIGESRATMIATKTVSGVPTRTKSAKW